MASKDQRPEKAFIKAIVIDDEGRRPAKEYCRKARATAGTGPTFFKTCFRLVG